MHGADATFSGRAFHAFTILTEDLFLMLMLNRSALNVYLWPLVVEMLSAELYLV